MRELLNDTEQEINLYIFNHYGQKMREQPLPSGATTTLPRKGLEIYTLNPTTGELKRVYLYKGKGAQPLSKSFIHYDFTQLDSQKLSAYILKGTQIDTPDKNSYEAFKTLSELNLQAGKDIITPKRYNKLWAQILAYKKECKWKQLLRACVRL